MRHAMVPMALLAALACGCSYSMHEYQAAGYAPVTPSHGEQRTAEPIHAHATQGVVLGVTDNTDYVDRAYAELLAQCAGDVVGVNTRYSSKLGFLSFRNEIDIQAFCLRPIEPERDPVPDW